MHQGLARLGPVAADVNHDLGRVLVLLEKQAIGDVLQIGKGLALAADQAAGIVGFDIEKNAVVQQMLFDSGLKTESSGVLPVWLWVAVA